MRSNCRRRRADLNGTGAHTAGEPNSTSAAMVWYGSRTIVEIHNYPGEKGDNRGKSCASSNGAKPGGGSAFELARAGV